MISLFFALGLARLTPPKPTYVAPLEVRDNAILLNAVVNGAPMRLMLDTGFSGGAVIDQSHYVGEPTGHEHLRDFVENYDAPTVPMTSLQIGSATLPCEGERIVLQPLGALSDAYGERVDGILGLGPLRHYVTEINIQVHELRLYPPTYNIGLLVADGRRTFASRLLPIGHSSLPMEVEAAGGRLAMSLDTGNAFYITTHRDVLERLGLWSPDRTPEYVRPSGVASGNVNTWSLHMENVRVFGVPVAHSIWDIIDLPSSAAESDGTVGFQFLQNFNITFDLDRRLVWLDNFNGVSEVEPLGEVGLIGGFARAERRVVVLGVIPGGPADMAGIRPSDQLLSIDGVTLGRQSLPEVRRLLQGPVGSTARIDVSREGQEIDVEIIRQLLVNEPDRGASAQ